MPVDSCGAVLEGYARRLVTTPVAVDHHHQRYPLKQHPLLPFHPHCYAKIPPPPMSPQNSPTTATMTASTPAPSKISVTFHSPAPTNSWWPDSIDCSERHHPDNEYLNSLITDELRTQLTVNTTVTAATSSSDEPFFKLSQHHSNLPQSPLSCLLRQIHLSNQPPPSTATRASALFDEDAVGGITGFSPVSSPQDTQGSLMTQETAALTDQHPPTGFSSAPMCIPINGHRCSSDVFDVPCGCGRCKVHGCGQDSAFNSTGTPTMGSTSLQSRTSEGQDSALALFEAKDDELQTGLPPDASLGSFVGCGSSYGSMLLPNVPANHFRQQSLISTPVITTTTTSTTHLSTSLQSPLADLRPDASECLSLRQELEITRRKLYSVLQELDSLRIDYADQTRLASALRVAVHQIVQIIFNHLTDTQRPQEEDSQGLPATTTTTMTTKTSSSTSSHLQQIGSNTFLVELLRVLLCDPVVRSTLSPLSMSPSSFSSSSKLNSADKSSRFLSGARHLLSGSRKCTSNAPGSWATSGGVLEELEEEESLRPSYPVDGDPEGCEEDDDYVDDEDELRRTLFATRQSQQPLRSAVEGKSISPSPSANSPIC